jgi:hypothetical protein
MKPGGADLRDLLSYSESWYIHKKTPYIGNNLYPPLASIMFTPLLYFDFTMAYKFITVISLICYIVASFYLPCWINQQKQTSPSLMLIFTSGLFSYGFHFEIERGQFNIIAFLICLSSISIFYRFERHRYLAYILFTLSVQLKVYPFIYIIMFIKDWGDYKNNIMRIAGLSILNISLLFILGPRVFFDFITAIRGQIAAPYLWIGNHSIRGFISYVSSPQAYKKGDQIPNLLWMGNYRDEIQIVFFSLVAMCLLLVVFRAYRRKRNGVDPYLLLACTISALLIPSVSHDYKLSILMGPMAIALSAKDFSNVTYRKFRSIGFYVLTFVLSCGYSSLLFSYTNKFTPLLRSALPALMIILFVTTLLSFFDHANIPTEIAIDGDDPLRLRA